MVYTPLITKNEQTVVAYVSRTVASQATSHHVTIAATRQSPPAVVTATSMCKPST
jgi:hypothetical protein